MVRLFHMLLGDCHMTTFTWASLPHPSFFLFFLEGINFFGLSQQLFGKGSSNTEKVLVFCCLFLIPAHPTWRHLF